MTQIQRGSIPDGLRRRFMTLGDASPDELADAISAVQVIENDREENMAPLGTRLCCAVGSSGAGGAGNFNFWQLHNPFASTEQGQSVLITLQAFLLWVETTLSVGAAEQLLVNYDIADATPVIGAKVGDGNFLDTRLALSGGNQPLPRGQLWLQQAANIGGGAWRPLFRLPWQGINTAVPYVVTGYPSGLVGAMRYPGIVLAPNTTLLLQVQGAAFANVISQVSFWWTERLMTEREGAFQQDTRHWTL